MALHCQWRRDRETCWSPLSLRGKVEVLGCSRVTRGKVYVVLDCSPVSLEVKMRYLVALQCP